MKQTILDNQETIESEFGKRDETLQAQDREIINLTEMIGSLNKLIIKLETALGQKTNNMQINVFAEDEQVTEELLSHEALDIDNQSELLEVLTNDRSVEYRLKLVQRFFKDLDVYFKHELHKRDMTIEKLEKKTVELEKQLDHQLKKYSDTDNIFNSLKTRISEFEFWTKNQLIEMTHKSSPPTRLPIN